MINSAGTDTLDVTGYRTELFLRSEASAALLKIINLMSKTSTHPHARSNTSTNTGNTDTNEKRNESMCKLQSTARAACFSSSSVSVAS